MIPLVDVHVHLLAGLDDGPRTEDEALAMCHRAYEEGVRMVSATAHQNEHWHAVTPERIHQAWQGLHQKLREAQLPLVAVPSAEIMVHPGMEAAWHKGDLLGLGGRREYLLLEMPHNLVVDLVDTIRSMRQTGVRPVLAHPERHEELLHEPGRMERLIEAGCLVQVCSGSLTRPRSTRDSKALRRWFRRGMVHLLGSDGHSLRRRPPEMLEAYRCICRWAGNAVADRIASTNGLSVLHGRPVHVPPPLPPARRWFFQAWWGTTGAH